MEQNNSLDKLQRGLVFATFFLFPIVFSPSFSNFFAVPKLILLFVIFALNLLIIAVRIIQEKKIKLHTSRLDSPLLLLGLSYLLSLVIISPNKVEAFLDPNRGALLIITLVSLVLTLPKERQLVGRATMLSLLIMFVATLASYFGVFKFLPQSLGFINNKGFNLMGNLLHQALYAGFFLALSFEQLRESDHKKANAGSGMLNLMFLAALMTTVLSLYVTFKDLKPNLFPLSTNWQISVEVLKNPKNAILGVGPANYVSLYTQAKPYSVNLDPAFWNLNVEYSRSALLHLFSEVGLIGVAALILILIQLYRGAKKHELRAALGVLVLWTLIFPLSQNYFFLLFLTVFLLREEKVVRDLNLKELDLFAYATALTIGLVVLAGGYFVGRAFYADYLLGQSAQAAEAQRYQDVYNLQVKSIQNNPYSITARSAFVRTNLVFASAIAQKKKPSKEDEQRLAQLLQQAIANARDAVSLNPTRASAWADLGSIYQSILGRVKDAETYAIASYQRAIALDPKNPNYYFTLGSIYYSLKNYDEATRFFEQAVTLKNDIPNYYYNLAWSLYQQGNFTKAVNALQTAQQFTKNGSNDYRKVQKDLTEFRKKLPKQETKTSETDNPETLSQPTTVPTGQPTLKLPTTAPTTDPVELNP